MAVDLLAALRYPYRKSNRLNAWVIPAVGILLVQLLTFGAFMLGQTASPELRTTLMILVFIVALLINILLSGFFWQMSGALQQEGEEAPAPPWWGMMTRYLLQGIKLYLYLQLVLILVNWISRLPLMQAIGEPVLTQASLLGMVVSAALFLLLGPVVAAPVIQSAGSYQFLELVNLKKAYHLLNRAYKNCLKAMLDALFVIILYIAIIMALVYLKVGVILVPFAIVPMLISSWHLMNQGFIGARDSSSVSVPQS